MLTLRADDLPPLCPLHRDLFDTSRAEKLDWSTLAERLRARLGDESLRGLRRVADHRPARAWRFIEGDAAERSHQRSSESIFADAGPRPFWLLKRSMILRDVPAQILAGPERIESGWWDDHDKRRDYYVIKTHQGQRAWAFVPVGVDDALGRARMVCMTPVKPRKPRRLRAPIEPDLPEADDREIDPRSALYKIAASRDDPHVCAIDEEREAIATNAADRPSNANASNARRYAELHCLSNFSFQRGASSARELFERPQNSAMPRSRSPTNARCAGIVRALEASDETREPENGSR